MSKHETWNGYQNEDSSLPTMALLTVWGALSRLRENLVLVGGLATQYLTHPPGEGQPGSVTTDVDLGIQLGVDSGQYGSIRDTLAGHGFMSTDIPGRFLKAVGPVPLYLDLLTDNSQHTSGVAMVDGTPVSIIPGVDRALLLHREVEVSGTMLTGARITFSIRVAEIGPMLALKLNAFGGPTGRQAPKDAHDILLLAMHYMDGIDAAIAGFRAEVQAGSRAADTACIAIHEHFLHIDALGPMACSYFRLGSNHLNSPHADTSLRIRQQLVTLALAMVRPD